MKGLSVKTPSLHPMLKSHREMIMAGGRLSQILGYPKSVGQIYGFLLFAVKPQSLDDIAGELGVSKASVSNGVRKLLTWGAVRQVWVQGDRREFLEIVDDESILLRAGYSDLIKPRISSSKRIVTEIGESLDQELEDGSLDQQEYIQVKGRYEKLKKIQKRFDRILPLLEKIL